MVGSCQIGLVIVESRCAQFKGYDLGDNSGYDLGDNSGYDRGDNSGYDRGDSNMPAPAVCPVVSSMIMKHPVVRFW